MVAVLTSALCFAVSAAAYPAQSVRLDSTRLFTPDSESLLGSFDGEIQKMSLLSQSIFNLRTSTPFLDRDIADLLMPVSVSTQAPQVNLTAVDRVQTYVPQLRASYVPAPALSAPPAAMVTDAAQSAPSIASLQQPDAPPTFPPVHFGSYTLYTPAVQSLAANVSVPVRIGNVHFNSTMQGEHQQSPGADAFRALQICGTTDENAACPYLRDSSSQSLTVGTDFNVRAGGDNVNLALSSSVSRITTGDAAIFPYVPIDPDAPLTSNFDAAGPDASVLQYSGLTGLVKHGVGASLAVPVNSRLTVGLQYDRSHYQGDYGNSLLPGVDAYKDTYLGNVTYQLPNTNSMLTLSARQYRYQDSLSNFNLTQTRADLNFTVKF
jgi:hypothetical protein